MRAIAVVFDNSGTIIKPIRVIKDIHNNRLLCNHQTVDLVDERKGRALIVLNENPLKTVDIENPYKLISDFLRENDISIAYCNPPIDKEGIFKDKNTKVKELQEVLNIVKKYKTDTEYGCAVIVDTKNGNVEYTIATGGCLFKNTKKTFEELKNMGIETYICTGDRKNFLNRISKTLGIDEKNIIYEAHHKKKLDLIRNLKSNNYFTIMVGDGANDIPAILESDLGIATIESGNPSKRLLEVSDIIIEDIYEVVDICKEILNDND